MNLILTLSIPSNIPPLWREILFTCTECTHSVSYNILDENNRVFHTTYQCLLHKKHYKDRILPYRPCKEYDVHKWKRVKL